jgi:perosamine synthetase
MPTPADAVPIDLSRPDITRREIAEVTAVLRTNRLALGPKLAEFERAVASTIGCRHAVAVNSGTSALHLIVRALGLGDGDEVITTPFSFIASANCLLYERAVPRFVDIDPVTLNLDCERIEAAITPRTRGILAVDVFGRPADWDRLQQLARAHGLVLIEDSCEALGARYRRSDGQWAMAGALADAGAFAFYPNKQITTGEGGVVVTDRDDIAALCRSMRNQGRDEGADWLAHARLGYNYRLPDTSAALGLAQLHRLEEILAARRRVAGWYHDLLAGLDGVETQTDAPGIETSWFVYVVRLLRSHTRDDLTRVIAALRARGIGCNNYFPPIHLQPFYQQQFGYREGDFPETERISCQTLALPFYNRLARRQVAYVVDCLREVLATELGGAAPAEPAAASPRRAA